VLLVSKDPDNLHKYCLINERKLEGAGPPEAPDPDWLLTV